MRDRKQFGEDQRYNITEEKWEIKKHKVFPC